MDSLTGGLERYFHSGPGYRPLVIRDGWQVAQLNYMPELAAEAIGQVERHNATDEVFVLVRGASVLIAMVERAGCLRFETLRMEPGVTYNVPAGVWHAIAMTPDDLVMIVEKSHTHLHDVEYRALSRQERQEMQSNILNEETHHE
jgi:ureidoglycolate hydrolase